MLKLKLKLKRKNCPGNVEPRWGSEDFVRFFLGCAVVTATPGFGVKPRWGWVRMEKMWVMSRARARGSFSDSVFQSQRDDMCLCHEVHVVPSGLTVILHTSPRARARGYNMPSHWD